MYAQLFAPNGLFWSLLSYCAGVGGSILIIGSAAGVAAMGLEKIDFIWNLKKHLLDGSPRLCSRHRSYLHGVGGAVVEQYCPLKHKLDE